MRGGERVGRMRRIEIGCGGGEGKEDFEGLKYGVGWSGMGRRWDGMR